MEEMMVMVKNSEKRCTEMTEAVNKKLNEMQDCARALSINPAAPDASTPNTSSPARSTNSKIISQFDDDEMAWEGIPTPTASKKKSRKNPKYTKSRENAYNGARGTRATVSQQHSSRDTSPEASPIKDGHLSNGRHAPGVSTNDAAEEALRLIAAAAQNKSVLASKTKGNPPKFVYPFDLVERGDTGRKIKKGESTREEYVLGLIRLSNLPTFPPEDIKPLAAHQAIIARDNCKLPWQLVRRYSEEIFSQIADGRIATGWKDTSAINLIRIETIAMSHINEDEATSTKYSRSNGDPKKQYDKASMGIPCVVWNKESTNCEKAVKGEKHGSGSQTYVHICGFCAYVRRVVANHPEHKCYSKKARAKQADQSEAQES